MAQLIVGIVAHTVLALAAMWGAAALWFRLPGTPNLRRLAVTGWSLVALVLVMLGAQGIWPASVVLLLLLAALLIWWFRLQPTHDRPWSADVVHLATGEVRGDRLTLHHVRDFDWHTRDEADEHWEERSYDLERLDSVDMIVSSWGRPGVAHVMISFGFEGERFVLFSVEVRRLKGERFSEIGGFFRQYELAIVAADERDAVGLRTKVRGERVSIYRLHMSRRAMRSLLLAYVDEANALVESPRFYNTITANCTSLIFDMARGIGARLPFDYRLLVTDRLPGYAFKVGGLWPGHSLPELEAGGRIDERARQVHRAPDFSQRIREGVPGWESLHVGESEVVEERRGS
ncbi:DUF4105 domain-containing protein [Halomonas sp. MCCC 1A11062]|uniref:Lnb N-terminal periplasmic domain-containing protein n=1 Tax=Halomonas sp. MCCC 1A11062 TaxID=2733485 RepID=UPI001F1A58C7|nr:DUF4105 domain-containing protein [Halomonas sp. MCCC 1A11062]MCE8038440.1 DUF4105 domain-containing protein [Halomonas sp. MCCC 1A11062]